jgi:hypothetical protein
MPVPLPLPGPSCLRLSQCPHPNLVPVLHSDLPQDEISRGPDRIWCRPLLGWRYGVDLIRARMRAFRSVAVFTELAMSEIYHILRTMETVCVGEQPVARCQSPERSGAGGRGSEHGAVLGYARGRAAQAGLTGGADRSGRLRP